MEDKEFKKEAFLRRGKSGNSDIQVTWNKRQHMNEASKKA